MREKLMITIPLLAAMAGVAAFKALAPSRAAPQPKIDGDIYVLGREFLVNLDAGRYAKLGVALVVHHEAGKKRPTPRERSRRRGTGRCRKRQSCARSSPTP